MKKIILYSLLGLVAVAGSAFAYLYLRTPDSRPAAGIKVAMTPERIARGKYIFTLADCDGCHTPADITKMYLPAIESKRGSGQFFNEPNFPGKVYVPNITPDKETGIGNWTDGEKVRAIREGISRDGSMLFPIMPYTAYRHMSDDDVQSLVAYLNTLAPVKNQQPRSQINFPVNLFVKGVPKPVVEPVATPDKTSPTYAEYLVTVGVCGDCHSDKQQFGGGRKFQWGDFKVTSANISPDKETGIGNWTQDYFLERFTRHRNMPVESLPPMPKEQFTIMPWRHLAQLPDEDLIQMYRYLMARPPVQNKVVVHPDAK